MVFSLVGSLRNHKEPHLYQIVRIILRLKDETNHNRI